MILLAVKERPLHEVALGTGAFFLVLAAFLYFAVALAKRGNRIGKGLGLGTWHIEKALNSVWLAALFKLALSCMLMLPAWFFHLLFWREIRFLNIIGLFFALLCIFAMGAIFGLWAGSEIPEPDNEGGWTERANSAVDGQLTSRKANGGDNQ